MSQTGQPSKTDLMYEVAYNSHFVPERSPYASVKTTTDGGRTANLLKNHHTGQYFELDEASNIVWDLIDGKRAVDEIYREVRSSGKVEEADAVNNSLLFFAENGFLQSAIDPIVRKRVRVVSSFMTEVTLIWDSTRIFRLIHRILRPILRTSLFWISMVIVVVGAGLFAPRFGSIFNDARNFQILGSTVVGFLFYNFIVLGPVITIHEMCHGIALMHYSGKTGEVGTGLFYFGPMFYVDATGYWSLSRRQRIMIMWAGNLSTLLIGAGIVISRFFVPYPASANQLLDMATFWCFYSTLWNLAPPFETDGYHILADIVNVPMLRADAFAYLKNRLLGFFGRPTTQADDFSRRKEKILVGYAIFAIALLAYIGVQTLRFTSYMAVDASSWAGVIWKGTVSSSGLSDLAYAVGLTSITYFFLTLSGYGVLIRNQVRKTLARGLKFDAVHDRNLSVFLYLPPSLPESTRAELESRMDKLAGKVAPSFSITRGRSLLSTSLRMGGANLPLSQVKPHLRKIEKMFFQTWYSTVEKYGSILIDNLVAVPDADLSLHDILRKMARNAQPEERALIREALKEFLQKERENTRYLLSSTFATVWALELPPSQEFELLQNVIPRLLVEDLMMTSLPDEIEDFKRKTVYGLDSIASLASESSRIVSNALNHPEKSQLVVFFEPVKGRLIFIGRTERVERAINSLGPVFTIQSWAGYLDNLLGDISLNLHAIVQSLPAVPPDLAAMRDGEIWTLRKYAVSLQKMESRIESVLTKTRDAVGPCKAEMKHLIALLEPERGSKIPLLDSILSLNTENLASIPNGIREITSLTREAFAWLKKLNQILESEWTKREPVHRSRNSRLVKASYALGPLSVGLAALGFLQPEALLAQFLIGLGALISSGLGVSYAIARRTGTHVPRYPSPVFTQSLTPLCALTQTVSSVLLGGGVLSPMEILDSRVQKGGKGEEKMETLQRARDETSSPAIIPH